MGKGANAFGAVFLFLIIQCVVYLNRSGKHLQGTTTAFSSVVNSNRQQQQQAKTTTPLSTTHTVSEESLLDGIRQEEEQHQNFSTAVAKTTTTTRPFGEIPPIQSIIRGKNSIVGDPQSLFHFAVAGFAKCGTTSLNEWLRRHPDTCVAAGELIFLRNAPARQVRLMHRLATSHGCGNGTKWNGYKNPHDVQYPNVLSFYRNKLAQTRLVVTVRHPVRFFESFYNYRITKGEMWSVKGTPNELVGGRDKPPYYVYSYSGAFHRYLVLLGKTLVNTPEERSLLEDFMHPNQPLLDKIPGVPNQIFLLESSQLSDTDPTRLERLAGDMQGFLGLPSPLPSQLPKVNTIAQKKRKRGKRELMDICDARYSTIREDTLQVARNASLWIRRYFLASPDVHVSSRDHLETLLESWMHDPCDHNGTTAT